MRTCVLAELLDIFPWTSRIIKGVLVEKCKVAVMILVKVVNGAMPPSKPNQWGIFGYLWAPYACSIKKPARRRKFDTSLFAINEPSGVPGYLY